MSSSRSQEDTYEAQNDQRLDELHSKIRTFRGVSHELLHIAVKLALTIRDAL
jgi:blocked-early-in-transport protein 1